MQNISGRNKCWDVLVLNIYSALDTGSLSILSDHCVWGAMLADRRPNSHVPPPPQDNSQRMAVGGVALLFWYIFAETNTGLRFQMMPSAYQSRVTGNSERRSQYSNPISRQIGAPHYLQKY
jgi:hypothetical protein